MDEIRRRIAPGSSSFYVLVPQPPVSTSDFADSFGSDGFAMVRADVDAQRRREDEAGHRIRLTSASRLNQLIDHIRAEARQGNWRLPRDDGDGAGVIPLERARNDIHYLRPESSQVGPATFDPVVTLVRRGTPSAAGAWFADCSNQP